MITKDFLNEKNFSVSLPFNDLKVIVKEIIEDTKRELKESITAQQVETYVSTKRACEMLDICAETMWRWNKRKYLLPLTIGGKKRYKMSDINKLLKN